MKQTLVIRLETNAAQRQTLLATLEAFNRACQHVADVAYDNRLANKIALQPLVYNDLRNRYGLSSQMAVRAISKACEAYKPDKRVHVRIPAHDPMILDQRLLSFKGLTHVSLLCLPGRQLIPFRFVSYARARHDRIAGHADLILREDHFLLHVCIDMPTPPPGVPYSAANAPLEETFGTIRDEEQALDPQATPEYNPGTPGFAVSKREGFDLAEAELEASESAASDLDEPDLDGLDLDEPEDEESLLTDEETAQG